MADLLDILKNLNLEGKPVVLVSDEDLKDIQKCLLDILQDVVDCCERHNIPYQLSGGSALGAVRHKGFIPWDDDIDLNMFRQDLKKFIPLFRKEYGSKYWIHVPGDSRGYDWLYVRILLKKVRARAIMDPDKKECGLGIDIFPIENTPDNFLLRKIHGFGYMGFRYVLSCIRFYRNKDELGQLFKNNKEFKAVSRKRESVGRFALIIPLGGWTKMAQSWIGLCKNNHSKYVSIASGAKQYFGELFEREKMEETIIVPFASMPVKITAYYDYYLSRRYGKYMEIPPAEKRERHVLMELDRRALHIEAERLKDRRESR